MRGRASADAAEDGLGPALAHRGVGHRDVGEGRHQCGHPRYRGAVGGDPQPVDSGDLYRGVIQSLVYSAIFTALAFRHFARRDVTS